VAVGADGRRLAAEVASLDARYRLATRPLIGAWGDAPWWWRRDPLVADRRPEQARANLAAIVAYGEEQAGVAWGGVYVNWEGPVASVACFTSDLDRHGEALRRCVPHPELLVVRHVGRNEAQLAAAREEIEDLLGAGPGQWGVRLGLGDDGFVVRVMLSREDAETAARLRARFGDLVRVEESL
jgi:hypothetical protein